MNIVEVEWREINDQRTGKKCFLEFKIQRSLNVKPQDAKKKKTQTNPENAKSIQTEKPGYVQI